MPTLSRRSASLHSSRSPDSGSAGSTIDALVDTAPKGLADRLARTIEALPGVAAIEAIRLRPSGAKIIGEVGIFVSRTLPLERVAAIKDDVARGDRRQWPQTWR